MAIDEKKNIKNILNKSKAQKEEELEITKESPLEIVKKFLVEKLNISGKGIKSIEDLGVEDGESFFSLQKEDIDNSEELAQKEKEDINNYLEKQKGKKKSGDNIYIIEDDGKVNQNIINQNDDKPQIFQIYNNNDNFNSNNANNNIKKDNNNNKNNNNTNNVV